MKCQRANCAEQLNLIPCFYPDNETGEPDYYYCNSHCYLHGFCCCCGQFWSGVESFEFAVALGGIEGVCENCEIELRVNAGEFDEEDDFDF